MTDPDELTARLTAELDERLAEADAALAASYPGERAERQPVHTAYVPADRFTADLARTWGAEALAMLDEHADKFATVVGDADIIRRVKAKLGDEPVEDLRIDFEDGYVGHDPDAEDEHVRTAAHALAESQQDETAPAFTGIRIKSFEASTRARGVRTLTRFLVVLRRVEGRPRRLRGDAAQGDEHRAGSRRSAMRRRPSSRSSGWAAEPSGSRCRSRRRRRCSAPTAPRWSRRSCTPPTAG